MLPKEWEDFFNLMPRVIKRIHEKTAATEVEPALEYTAAQFNTLRAISSKDEWRMSDLSRRLRVSAGSLTTMINRLIEAGLVQRTRSDLDRRVVTVRLTDNGKELLLSAKQRAMRNLQDILAVLPSEDQKQMSEALGTLVEILSKVF